MSIRIAAFSLASVMLASGAAAETIKSPRGTSRTSRLAVARPVNWRPCDNWSTSARTARRCCAVQVPPPHHLDEVKISEQHCFYAPFISPYRFLQRPFPLPCMGGETT